MAAQNNFEENNADLNFKGLPKPQKNAVIVLAALAVFVVVFWVWQMKSHINGPFDYKTASSEIDVTEDDFNNLLMSVDTDKDGLSDYDEIYTYKSSPYLEDTDSDGIIDKAEVDGGNDPLCPQGKDCNAAIDTSIAASTASSTSGSIEPLSGLDAASSDEAALTKALSGTSDAATLRQLLISSGVSIEDLNKISDEDLMKSYQETLESQNASLE